MVDLSTLQAVSYIMGSLGVFCAATYYIMNVRMNQRKSRIEAAMWYGDLVVRKDKVLDWRHLLYNTDYSNFAEWEQKYINDPVTYSALYSVAGSMSLLGIALKENMVSCDELMKLVSPLCVKVCWGKLRPVVMGMREIFNDPRYAYYTEYLYNEIERKYPDVHMPQNRYPSYPENT